RNFFVVGETSVVSQFVIAKTMSQAAACRHLATCPRNREKFRKHVSCGFVSELEKITEMNSFFLFFVKTKILLENLIQYE
ncbi:MAG: hypothetical protein ACOWWR_15515, partial [Eubacteriales bacterium]